MIRTLREVLLGFSILALFPWVFAHELSHGVVAWARGYDTRIVLFPQPRAAVSMDDPARLDLFLIAIAPIVSGLIVGGVLLAFGGLPIGYLPVDLYVLVGWVVLTTPSKSDLSSLRV